ncbi:MULTISPECIES: hypothetical protein [unclassified Coleofasciculus]|uniref:hypothetical protein n=1 Tax=unclassified Coleofasciculus TaxID=2692782 RepID=UPI00187F1FA6|nr:MULTISPECIES: hypothetical protein [unclassified Coleofasciculus]MBE9125917.1 hypothetical protein [Coleofasciculus sp. LEGE 07081]MBE9149288.1 hypothetical protein [Coleofasciculus sp. LEGE 07092]
MPESLEESLISNKFGTISIKQVTFLSNKGLFNKGAKEEIPLTQIVAVRFYQPKSWATIITGSLGLVLFFALNIVLSGSFIAKLSGLLVLVAGIGIAYLGFCGIPTVAITKTGGRVTEAKGWPQERSEAKAFALILREKIAV